MPLGKELKFKTPIVVLEHEAVLNIYYTASQIKKKADEFFSKFDLTDVQFNVLMLLTTQTGNNGGLRQAEIGEMMLVTRANVPSLIDRMEKAGLLKRGNDQNDRRSNLISMTDKGRKLFGKVVPIYYKQIGKVVSGVDKTEQKTIISVLERIRAGLNS